MVEEELDRLHKRIDKIEEKVDAVATQISKQKGFLAGVAFGVSAIWGAAVGIWEMLHTR